jgi:HAMP domain-containing protein
MTERDLTLLVVLAAVAIFILVVVTAGTLELARLAEQVRQAVPR